MPADHAMRDTDHDAWIQAKLDEYPDAEFRPHPKMVPPGSLEPLQDVFDRTLMAITYNSNVGHEALVEGCRSYPEHYGSLAYDYADRETWLHEVSWTFGHHSELASRRFGQHILSGFEEAREHARNGVVERPRPKRNRVYDYNFCSWQGLRKKYYG
jgi:hypothetical protein